MGIAGVDTNEEKLYLKREGHVKKCGLSLFLEAVMEEAVRSLIHKAFHNVGPSNVRQLSNGFCACVRMVEIEEQKQIVCLFHYDQCYSYTCME